MKKLIFTAALLLCALILISCGSPKVVKQIGGFDVDGDLYSFFSENDGAVASFLAPYAIAKDVGYDITTEEFSNICEVAKTQMLMDDYAGDEAKLKAEIEDAGMTDELYDKVMEQDTLKKQLYLMLTENGTIETDSAVLREKFEAGEAVYVKRILLKKDTPDAMQTLSDVREKAVSGEKTFERLRADLALDLVDGDGIGTYGDGYIVLRGNTDKDYEDVCFSLEVNEIGEPFETDAGFCLVKRCRLTSEILDETMDVLVTSYCEGQFNIMLEEKAEEMLK